MRGGSLESRFATSARSAASSPQVRQYIVAQVLGGLAAGAVLYLIASGKAGFELSAGFAGSAANATEAS